MVRIVQDIDRWPGECGTTVEHDAADGTRVIGECTLHAGHDGTHDDHGAGRLVAARFTGQLRDLADAVERICEHFGWSAPAVDRDLTGAAGAIANSHDTLACVVASLDTMRRRTTRLTEQLRAVDIEPDALRPGPAQQRCVPPPAARPCPLVCSDGSGRRRIPWPIEHAAGPRACLAAAIGT
jgi:hypothetical protein